MTSIINDINSKIFYIYDSNNISSYDEIKNYGVSINYTNPTSISIKQNDPTLNIGSSFIYISSIPSNINILKTNYSKSGPFNLFDLNKELTNRMNELISGLDILQRCNIITKYVTNKNIDNAITKQTDPYFYTSASNQKDGQINFTTDTSACSVFDSTYTITGGNNTKTDRSGIIFNTTKVYNNDKMIKIPDFNNTFFTQYPSGQNKGLNQMLGDINNLLNNYKTILSYYSNSSSYNDKQKYDNGDYNISNLQKIFNQNLALRQELDQKIQAVLATKGSYTYNSKIYMDSTVYANIMWSILATTLIYFVLVKM
jgi:hypothetical protein